jgi:hypothetical protein
MAHIKSCLQSQAFNSTELHSIILMPQFLKSIPLLPNSCSGRLAFRILTDSLPSIFSHLRLLPKEIHNSNSEQSSSLLPATSQHGHSWHRAPLGPMAIYLFRVKTFFFFFRCSSFDKKGGVGLFFVICVPLLHLKSKSKTKSHCD